MLDDRRLNLRAVDVLPAADHHVFHPVDDVEVSVLVHVADIAAVVPAVHKG